MKLSIKDKKLLYLLHLNCRLSNTRIGKMIRLSKDGVKYKIDKFFKIGLINNYYLNLNYEKLGFRSYIVLLRLQKIDNKKQERITEEISKKKYITYCATCFGNWDLWLEIVTNSIINFDNYMEKIIKLLGSKLVDYQTFIAIREYKPYSNVISEYFKDINLKYKDSSVKKFKSIKLDKLDKKILTILSKCSSKSALNP